MFLEADKIIIGLYMAGSAFWLIFWYLTGSLKILLSNKLLYVPLLLVPIVFFLEIFFILWYPAIADFSTEKEFIFLVERNNQQLLTASFSMIVMASTFSQIKKSFHITKDFIFFISTALIFSIGGVLVIYWFPAIGYGAYLLRHIKTIPYTFSLGLVLSGFLMIVREMFIPENHEKESL